MRKILYHTFVSVIITSIVLTLLYLPASLGLILMPFLLILFCAPFPAFLAVLIYEFANRKLFPNDKVYAVLFGVLLLLFIYHLFLAVFIVTGYNKPWSSLINTISDGYFSEFAIANVSAIVLAISVPLADILIKKVQRDLN